MNEEIKNNKNISKYLIILIVGILLGAGGLYGYETYEQQQLVSSVEEIEKASNANSEYLRIIKPISCTSSSELSDDYSCENLSDDGYDGWRDNNKSCIDQWVSFTFDKGIYLEFVVITNYERETDFLENKTIENILITFPESEYGSISKTLKDERLEQWIDLNVETSVITFNVASAYEDTNDTCGIQEVRFYGKG